MPSAPALARRTLFAAALVAFGAAFAACGGDDDGFGGGTVALFGGTVPPDGPALDLSRRQETNGRQVVMIGDSITVASTPSLEATARQLDVDLTIHAEVGRRIAVGSQPAAGVDVLSEVLANTRPDLLVIALGANDIGKYVSVEEYAGQVEILLDLVADDVPIVWIDAYLSESPDSSATFNEGLAVALSRRGNASIGRWSEIASADGVLSDGIHPTDEGTELFSALVGEQVRSWVG